MFTLKSLGLLPIDYVALGHRRIDVELTKVFRKKIQKIKKKKKIKKKIKKNQRTMSHAMVFFLRWPNLLSNRAAMFLCVCVRSARTTYVDATKLKAFLRFFL